MRERPKWIFIFRKGRGRREEQKERERERERERGCVGIKTEECSLVGRIRQIVLTIASLMFRVI